MFAVVAATVAGCATSTYTYGKPFDTSKVALIKKGETTMQQVQDWFGEPFTKTVAGSDSETWVYMYTRGRATAQSSLFNTNVNQKETLRIWAFTSRTVLSRTTPLRTAASRER